MAVFDPVRLEAELDQAAAAAVVAGTSLTELRRAVLRLILVAEGPLTAYQLLDRLKEARPGAAPTTIYRALDFLLAQRLIHRIERLNAFVGCVEAGHHAHAAQFLICRRCGAVREIEDHRVAAALRRAALREGFQPGHAMVEIDGLCAACTASG